MVEPFDQGSILGKLNATAMICMVNVGQSFSRVSSYGNTEHEVLFSKILLSSKKQNNVEIF